MKYEEYLSRLVGGMITAVAMDDFDETIEEYGNPLFALIVTMPDGRKLQVAIMQDAEGNGAGHLDIISLN